MMLTKKHSAYLQLLIRIDILMNLQFQPTFFYITSNNPKNSNKHLNTREQKTAELIKTLKDVDKISGEKYLNGEKLSALY